MTKRPTPLWALAKPATRAGLAAGIYFGAVLQAEAASPVFPVFGSYFPAWLVCAVLGIVVTVILRRVFVSTGINAYLPLAPLVYLCLAVTSSIVIWFIWTGGGIR